MKIKSKKYAYEIEMILMNIKLCIIFARKNPKGHDKKEITVIPKIVASEAFH